MNQTPDAFILASGSVRAFFILNYDTESRNIFMYLKTVVNIFYISKGIFIQKNIHKPLCLLRI